jgi:flavoprotein
MESQNAAGTDSSSALFHETKQARRCEKQSDEESGRLKMDRFAQFIIGPATSGRTSWLAVTSLFSYKLG